MMSPRQQACPIPATCYDRAGRQHDRCLLAAPHVMGNRHGCLERKVAPAPVTVQHDKLLMKDLHRKGAPDSTGICRARILINKLWWHLASITSLYLHSYPFS